MASARQVVGGREWIPRIGWRMVACAPANGSTRTPPMRSADQSQAPARVLCPGSPKAKAKARVPSPSLVPGCRRLAIPTGNWLGPHPVPRAVMKMGLYHEKSSARCWPRPEVESPAPRPSITPTLWQNKPQYLPAALLNSTRVGRPGGYQRTDPARLPFFSFTGWRPSMATCTPTAAGCACLHERPRPAAGSIDGTDDDESSRPCDHPSPRPEDPDFGPPKINACW